MKKIILKILNILRWIVGIFLGFVSSMCFMGLLICGSETGGDAVSDIDQQATVFLILGLISGTIVCLLTNLEGLSHFFRKKFLWRHYRIIIP